MSEKTYGGRGTIHQTGEVNVETDNSGVVVAVWYRCMLLPFTQTPVDAARGREMSGAYECTEVPDAPGGLVFHPQGVAGITGIRYVDTAGNLVETGSPLATKPGSRPIVLDDSSDIPPV